MFWRCKQLPFLGVLNKLFKQTFIYGLATVLPRMLSFLLTPLYTGILPAEEYGEISIIFSWFAIINVLLAYGMETAFFRFYHSQKSQAKVTSTALVSLFISTALFVLFALVFKNAIAEVLSMPSTYIGYAIIVLALDALVIVPFAWLRANGKATRYAVVKLLNVITYTGLAIFFLLIVPRMAQDSDGGLFSMLYRPNFEISYIFWAMISASGITFLFMLSVYFKSSYSFDSALWKRMLRYALPVLWAGMAYTVIEMANRILLDGLLPNDVARIEVAKFSACVKLALFMTLFATAFRLGIEPFFFSHAKTKNPQKAYAQITNYFVILGSVILLAVVVFSDVLKRIIVRNEELWEAMEVVPMLLVASFCLGIYHNLSVWYKITDRTRFGAYFSSVGAALTLLINILLIPKIGYLAAAWGTLIAYASMMALSFYYGKKYYPIPYNLRKIGFYGGLSILFSFLSFYVFHRNLIIGTLLLSLFLGLVYKLEGDRLRTILLKRED